MSGQKNAYFANSLNTSHRHRFALASIRKVTPRPAFDRGQRKADRRGVAVLTSNCRGLLFKEYGRLGNSWKIQRKFVLCSGGKSLSSAFTQTRLFGPDGVKILFLMLTYLSTLRSKTGFCLVRPKNAYFANSLNTSHRLRSALASIRKATPRPASDRGQRKAKSTERKAKSWKIFEFLAIMLGYWVKSRNSKNERHYGIWLKRTLIRAKAFSGIYASRREIT